MQFIDWKNIDLVILDVDGTLYNQTVLRRKMLLELVKYFLIHPWRFRELLILYHFRKERERHTGFTGSNLEEEQYQWCKTKTGFPIEKIKKTVEKWIFTAPNEFLSSAMFPEVATFFGELRNKNILVATLSDYPAKTKMETMMLTADLNVSGTDAEINVLKPATNGLQFILRHFQINDPRNCLFIGDRAELDGRCANKLDVPFLLIEKKHAVKNFYSNLLKQINATTH